MGVRAHAIRILQATDQTADQLLERSRGLNRYRDEQHLTMHVKQVTHGLPTPYLDWVTQAWGEVVRQTHHYGYTNSDLIACLKKVTYSQIHGKYAATRATVLQHLMRRQKLQMMLLADNQTRRTDSNQRSVPH